MPFGTVVNRWYILLLSGFIGEGVDLPMSMFNLVTSTKNEKEDNKFSLMWPRLKLGYNSRLKHKSNWNFCTSY